MNSLLVAALLLSPAPSADFDPFLNDLSHRAFRYFWEQSHPETGFTLDRANNTKDEPREQYVSSIAATGFALSAYAVGTQRKWVRREDALEKARMTLRAIEARPNKRHRGWFFHFVDWETGERVWKSEVSTIDTSIFLAGMLLAESYFNDREFTRRADRILRAIDWEFMLTDAGAAPSELHFTMGWHPETGFIKARWRMWCELMMLYVQAYGAYPRMPRDSWAKWERPIIEYKGYEMMTGGPLFLVQMSHVFYDFRGLRDRLGFDYWVQGRNHTLAQRVYAIDNPKGFKGYGADIWGLSACDGPDGYGAFGAPGWIDDNGTLAPAATVASVMFTPELSLEAGKAFAQKFPESLGRYGFTTGLNPTRAWQSPDVIGIDLGQLMLAIENHRDGFAWKYSGRHEVNRNGMREIGFSRTDEGPLEGRALRR